MKRQKFFLAAIICAVCALVAGAGLVLAQENVPSVDIDVPGTVQEVAENAKAVIDDWKNLGWVAGAIAIIVLLVSILRLPIINNWMEAKNLKRFKPYISGFLGGLIGLFSTLQTGAGVVQSIIYGVIAGLAASGSYDVKAAHE